MTIWVQSHDEVHTGSANRHDIGLPSVRGLQSCSCPHWDIEVNDVLPCSSSMLFDLGITGLLGLHSHFSSTAKFHIWAMETTRRPRLLFVQLVYMALQSYLLTPLQSQFVARTCRSSGYLGIPAVAEQPAGAL